MLQIKSVISKLKQADYEALLHSFREARADKFHTVMEKYRKNSLTDEKIQEELGMTSNAFYVLRSRLYEKVQAYLLDQSVGPKTDILRKIITIPKLLYDTKSDIAIAVLSKLEKDLIANDMPQELTSVYAALKKLHLHSPKFYEYSQKYNRHVAFNLALDKAEEMLGDFTRILGDWHASRNRELLDYFKVLKKEMDNLARLYDSHHLKVSQHILNVSIALFLPMNEEVRQDEPVEDALKEVEMILESYPADTNYQYFKVALNFLYFQYYHQLGLDKKADQYFGLVNAHLPGFLNYNHLTCCTLFLISKLERYVSRGNAADLFEESRDEFGEYEPDKDDIPNYINYVKYRAAAAYYAGRYSDASRFLSGLLNGITFKNHLHAEIEIKLFLTLTYSLQNKYDLAWNLLRSVTRKLREINGSGTYRNALAFANMLKAQDNQMGGLNRKIQKHAEEFILMNETPDKMLGYLDINDELIAQLSKPIK